MVACLRCSFLQTSVNLDLILASYLTVVAFLETLIIAFAAYDAFAQAVVAVAAAAVVAVVAAATAVGESFEALIAD